VRLVLVASLCIFTASPFLPNSSFWAYAALPGILFAFLSGILINRKDFGFIKILWPLMLFLLIAFGFTKYFHTGLRTGIHVNVAIGYLIAIIATICLDKLSPSVKWDRFLGLFSYPLFLCHGVVAEFLRRFWHVWNPLELLFASVLFAGILILTVEIPSDYLRYRLRGRVTSQNLEKARTSQN
jgi:peptidoglycan/LPS O-acetylase OafA/YrhL